MEGWANASVVIGSGEGAELHRIRSVDPSGTVLRIGRPTERAHTAQPGVRRQQTHSPRTPRAQRAAAALVAAAAAAEAERPQSARECYASDGKRTGLDLEHRVPC